MHASVVEGRLSLCVHQMTVFMWWGLPSHHVKIYIRIVHVPAVPVTIVLFAWYMLNIATSLERIGSGFGAAHTFATTYCYEYMKGARGPIYISYH